ncbi:hypothetical protein POVCU2_0026080 [Plasmodium ovale curtisi]|uniref:Uncharacterized protein n=1 Tax=Plasmodium ovale curtisi TaxID=864141 RepID=A0A1A8VV50_PLAOA|nr:hypothetical protein POVCU2_0026080 [Plasmodium ovale curtisi]SBS92690.1 hypothetical protein POVCU1_023810 [Plasmodium ovale curtisi]
MNYSFVRKHFGLSNLEGSFFKAFVKQSNEESGEENSGQCNMYILRINQAFIAILRCNINKNVTPVLSYL